MEHPTSVCGAPWSEEKEEEAAKPNVKENGNRSPSSTTSTDIERTHVWQATAWEADTEHLSLDVGELEEGSKQTGGSNAGAGRPPIAPPTSVVSRWPFEASPVTEKIGSAWRWTEAHQEARRKMEEGKAK